MEYLALVGCYLLGAIPFGLIVGKVTRGIDIRDYGSGNIGASNVLRTLGPGPAFAVFFLDTVKGLGAVALCRGLGLSDYGVVAGGLLSILGHSFSVFLGLKGGKGVATSLGMVIGLNPVIAGIGFAVWLAVVGATRYISLGSVAAALCVPAMMILWKSMDVPPPYQITAFAAGLLIVVKHISNMKRLLSGTETRIGQKVRVETGQEVESLACEEGEDA